MLFTSGPYSGKSTLALVARVSIAAVGVVYGSVKLGILKVRKVDMLDESPSCGPRRSRMRSSSMATTSSSSPALPPSSTSLECPGFWINLTPPWHSTELLFRLTPTHISATPQHRSNVADGDGYTMVACVGRPEICGLASAHELQA